MEANMFPAVTLVWSVSATKPGETDHAEGRAAKAIWKKAEVLFFQFCGKQMVILVTVVSFRPALELLNWVSVPGSPEVRLERMNQR